jgi:alkylhydroperoxidase family enzyme
MELPGSLVQSIFDDYTTASINEKLRAMLGFLEKVTLHPSEVAANDILPLQNIGISNQAIEDALLICALFNIIARIVDALDVAVPTPEKFAQSANFLWDHGYL